MCACVCQCMPSSSNFWEFVLCLFSVADPLASALLKKRATLYMSMLASAVEMKKERNIDVLTCASQVSKKSTL